ncbi:M20/M25/M40 family metallo-hydrolase [Candidatus Margulisiibacteriota bacterium]
MVGYERIKINQQRLITTFLNLVKIDSPSGNEGGLIRFLMHTLPVLGIKCKYDKKMNILGTLPATISDAPSVMLSAHMDSVQPCKRIHPKIVEEVICSSGDTVLGADSKLGIAIIIEFLRIIKEKKLPHPTFQVVFTVESERNLRGAKSLDQKVLTCDMGIVFRSHYPVGTIIHSGPSLELFTATITGTSAQTALNPNEGVSAIQVASEALIHIPVGEIAKKNVCNIGTIQGGRRPSLIPDSVVITGELRSHMEKEQEKILSQILNTFEKACNKHSAHLDFLNTREFDSFQVEAKDRVVCCAQEAFRDLGIEPHLISSYLGSDANIFNGYSIPSIVIGQGIEHMNTVNEKVSVKSLSTCLEFLLAFNHCISQSA